MSRLKTTAVAVAIALLASSVAALDYVTFPTVYVIGPKLELGDLYSSNNGSSYNYSPIVIPSVFSTVSPVAPSSQPIPNFQQALGDFFDSLAAQARQTVALQNSFTTPTFGTPNYAVPIGTPPPPPPPVQYFPIPNIPPAADGRPIDYSCGLADCTLGAEDMFGFVMGGEDVLVQKLTTDGPNPQSFEFKSSDLSLWYTSPEALRAATKESCLETIKQEKDNDDRNCTMRTAQISVVGVSTGAGVAGTIILAGVLVGKGGAGLKLGTWAGGVVTGGVEKLASQYHTMCSSAAIDIEQTRKKTCGD